MTQPKNIFGWLFSSDRDTESDEVGALWRAYGQGRQRNDTEAVRIVKEGFEALGDRRCEPWIGVFGRHWELQYRICDLRQGAAAIPDAVKAFELSTRPENLDCPQSVCTVQDLCIAFSATDGPGYADQVIATCEDTLERIDPSWPCFDCINNELGDGLINNGEGERALQTVRVTEQAIRDGGGTPSSHLFGKQVEAMMKIDLDTAADFARTFDAKRFEFPSTTSRASLALVIGQALMKAGHTSEANEYVGTWPDPLIDPGLSSAWVGFAAAAVEAQPSLNTVSLRSTAVRVAHLLFDGGSYRTGFEVAILAGSWCAAVGALTNGRRCLGLAIEISKDLVRPLEAPLQMATLEADLLSGTTTAIETEDQRVEELELRGVRLELQPEDVSELSQLRAKQGWLSEANNLAVAHARQDLTNRTAVLLATNRLLESRDFDQAMSFAEQVTAVDATTGRWILAMTAFQAAEWDLACSHSEAVLEADDTALEPRRLWAHSARNLGDFTTASRLRAEVLELSVATPSPARTSDVWAAVVDGSAAQEDSLVRQAAHELDMDLDGDRWTAGQQEEIIVVSTDEAGRHRGRLAIRTGPATAKIIQVAMPYEELQLAGDEVVFIPAPLPSHAVGADALSRFRVLCRTSEAGHESTSIEGASSNPEASAELQRALIGAGFLATSYGYNYSNPDGEERFSIEMVVAVGADTDEVALRGLLENVTKDWQGIIAWPDLLERLGESPAEHLARLTSLDHSIYEDEDEQEGAGDET